MRAFLIVASSLALAACAAPSQPEPATPTPTAAAAAAPASAASGQAVASNEPKVVCRRELPLGSTIPHTVCERTEANAAETAAMQRELEQEARRNRPFISGSGGYKH